MDIKKIINDTVAKLQKDPGLAKKFLDNPTQVLEQLTGLDLPDDQINAVVTGIKAKLTADKLGGAVNALGGLFGKK